MIFAESADPHDAGYPGGTGDEIFSDLPNFADLLPEGDHRASSGMSVR